MDLLTEYKKFTPSRDEVEAVERGSWEDRETILRLFEIVQWSQQGFVELNVPSGAANMTSLQDMRSRVQGALRAGITLWRIPEHPHDYNTTVRGLYEGICNPRWREAALKGEQVVYREGVDLRSGFSTSDIEVFLPGPVEPEFMGEQALWGRGWFGTTVPGYSGAMGMLFRGVLRDDLPALRNRGYSDMCRARLKEHAYLIEDGEKMDVPVTWYAQFKIDLRAQIHRVAVAPPAECLNIIAPCEDELWAIEEKAADGDFLAHCTIRALFVGVAKARTSVSDADLTYIARRHPVSSLIAHVRLWRHADTPAGRLASSEAMFMQEGFISDCIQRGKQVLRDNGGLKRPSDFPHGLPLELTINEVPVKLMMGMLIMDSKVADIIGPDAMDGACAKAKEELESFGINLPMVHLDPSLFAPPTEEPAE